MSRSETGKFGEDLACSFLLDKGYEILDRNYRRAWGEIDIIAREINKTLVFVEVKTIKQYSDRLDEDRVLPEDQMTKSKLKKLRKISEYYAREKEARFAENRGWRIDLIAINVFPNSETQIKHYINI